MYAADDALRCLEIPGTHYIKAELMFRHKDEVAEADWILCPEYWQVNSLTYGFKKRIFPSPASYHLGHDKVEMTRAFWALCPEYVPQTLILPTTDGCIEQVLDIFDFPVLAKEVRNSMGRGVHLIESRSTFATYCRRNDIFYIQEYLPIMRDLRVVFVGNKVIGAYWRNGRDGAYRNNVAQGGSIDYSHRNPLSHLISDLAHEYSVVNHYF